MKQSFGFKLGSQNQLISRKIMETLVSLSGRIQMPMQRKRFIGSVSFTVLRYNVIHWISRIHTLAKVTFHDFLKILSFNYKILLHSKQLHKTENIANFLQQYEYKMGRGLVHALMKRWPMCFLYCYRKLPISRILPLS